jgi:predicted nuclease with RNAse H fold
VTAVGIDVGGRRKGFHACALSGREIVGGPERLGDVAATVAWIIDRVPTTVAIDSPRECAPPGKRSRPDERDFVAAGICHIRWTPERSRLGGNPYYEWIEHGLELYAALAGAGFDDRLIEVFPTSAWTIWAGPRGKRSRAAWSRAALADLGLAGVPSSQSQDDRDAIGAALVARLHDEGRSRAFGAIIIPAYGPPAAPRRARTSPGRPAAGRDRPMPDRPG